MIVKGGVLGIVQIIHHDPYLNGTTVPIDYRFLSRDLDKQDSVILILLASRLMYFNIIRQAATESIIL